MEDDIQFIKESVAEDMNKAIVNGREIQFLL